MNGIEEFLDCIRLSPPGGRLAFAPTKHGRRSFVGSVSYEFYVDNEKKKHASLLVLKEHSDLLSGFSIQAVSSLLTKFFQEIVEDLGVSISTFVENKNRTVLEVVSPPKLKHLPAELKKFLEENLMQSIFCMPVSGIPCLAERSEGQLMWVPNNFNLENLTQEFKFPARNLQTSVFPPMKEWRYKQYPLTSEDSWFVVRARDESIAESYFRIMSGALSVVLEYPQSRMITGREMINGRVEFKPDGSNAFNFKECVIPPVSLPFKARPDADQLFWRICNVDGMKRTLTSLEFLSEAWRNSRVIAFVNAAIAIDALFGINGKVRKSILAGIEKHCVNITAARDKYALILDIRNDILHGEVSSLETSTHYLSYYEKFNNNPAYDQIIILNECLISVSQQKQTK